MGVDPTFSELQDHADLLTPYATTFRYPGDFSEPELEDVKEALEAAEQVLNTVNLRLSVDSSKRQM